MKKVMLFVLIAVCVCKTTGSFGQTTNVQDSLALVDLYDSTVGADWFFPWNLANPVSTWYGVSVTNGRVTSINLSTYNGMYGNNLNGSLPSSLGNLSYLTSLIAYGNTLSGSIPASLGNLSNLEILELYGNQLSESIPAALGNLSNLTHLDLSDNQLSGNIPIALGNLSKLVYLVLGGNQLSGSIPAPLGNLSKLSVLSLAENQLSGSIPAVLGNLPKLENFELQFNQLSGSIPAQFGNLFNLGVLSLNNNQLSGSIPAEFGNLSKLGGLYLEYNQLSGSIPAEFGNLSILYELDLEDNQLSDSIPAALDSLSNLAKLELQDNHFTFAGMEGIESAYEDINIFQYAPQATIPLNYQGGQLSVSVGGTPTNNTYYWYKDNVLYKTIGGDSVLTITENGNYSVSVTNAIATLTAESYTDLVLYSDTVTVTNLPVSLLSFTATKEGNKSLLQWTTANEVNSSYFEAERSSDGVSFTGIGHVDAAGNSGSAKNYSLVDAKPVNGMNYYRLKVVDKDGEFSYSQIRTINEGMSFGVSIYPNPVKNSLNLNFSSDKAMTVQVVVVDNGGKVVATQQMEIASGASTQGINVGGLSGGTYYVRLVGSEGEAELRFVKE